MSHQRMKNDGLGEWQRLEEDGHDIEWRRRKARAQDAHLSTDFVIDISIDGAAPETQPDFDDRLDQAQELQIRIRQLVWATEK